jgi:MFS family permease
MENQTKPNLRYAWYVVFILLLANISSFVDRSILALLVEPIKRDLHLTDTQISLLMGLSFALFYTFFGVLIGHFADKFNRRNIIIAGITVWSLMTALCGGVQTFNQFFLSRIGVGVGEATLSPSAYSMISDYFPKNKLSRALSTYALGSFLGTGVAILIGGLLISYLPTRGTIYVPILGEIFQWQMLFVYIGLPGFLIALLVFTVKEPIRKDAGQVSETKATLKEALEIIWIKRKAYLPMCVATAFTAFVGYGSSAWIPTFFQRTFGWEMQEVAGKYGIVSTIFSTLGVLAGGWLADRYQKQGVLNGKVRVGLISGFGIFLSVLVFFINDPNMLILSSAFPAFFIAFPIGAAVAAVQELMPNRVRALASSIYLFFVNIIGMGAGPFTVAFFTDSIFHDEKMIKHSLLALYIIGGLATIIFYALALKPYREEISKAA